MITCPACNDSHNEDAWEHCGNCGAPLSEVQVTRSVSPLWLLAVAAALITLGFLTANVSQHITIGGIQ
jgi:uncharacterized paraquat-inducible protein A